MPSLSSFTGGCPLVAQNQLFFGVEKISIFWGQLEVCIIFWVAEKINSGQNEFLEIDSIGCIYHLLFLLIAEN